MTSTHYLSLEPAEFREIALGHQHAVCLGVDQGVIVGDQLVLREHHPSPDTGGVVTSSAAFTGAWLMRRVVGAFEGKGVQPGYRVCSLGRAADNERAIVALKRQIGLAERQGITVEKFFRLSERKESARRAILRQSRERVERVRRREGPELESGR